MNLLQNHAKIELSPFLRLKNTVCSFPEEPGTYRCRLTVLRGSVIFRHESYSTDDGMWNDVSPMETPREQIFSAGTVTEFTFTIALHYGQPDHVTITNQSYCKPAVFTCSYEKIDVQEVTI